MHPTRAPRSPAPASIAPGTDVLVRYDSKYDCMIAQNLWRAPSNIRLARNVHLLYLEEKLKRNVFFSHFKGHYMEAVHRCMQGATIWQANGDKCARYGAHGPSRILLMAMLALNLSANFPASASQRLPPAFLMRHNFENHSAMNYI